MGKMKTLTEKEKKEIHQWFRKIDAMVAAKKAEKSAKKSN